MAIFTPSPTFSSDTSDEDNRKMEIAFFNNDFPKGDLQDLLRRLHDHSKDRGHPMLAHFIEEATRVVKEEVRLLPAEMKHLFPPFETIFLWAEDDELRSGLLGSAVEGALLIVLQIATYIGYAEIDHKNLNHSASCLTGLGVGLLASAAVSVSSTLSDLVLAGADAVRLAFRLGVHVQSVSQNIEARDPSESPDPWAFVIHNVDPETVQRELDLAHSQAEKPGTARIFISALGKKSVTVSGPPGRLKALFLKSTFFRDARSIALPVYGGLCHAPHIYGPQDVQAIVHAGSSDASGRTSVRSWRLAPVSPTFSTSTGLPFPATNAVETFECVVSELLTQAIEWDRVVDGVIESVLCSSASEVEVFCFGNSISLDELHIALKANIDHVSLSSMMPWISKVGPSGISPRSTIQSKLAIVGMSCRLPGGATDTEKFWEILEKGLDVSRKIPSDRFDIDSHHDPTGTQMNKTMTQFGCFIDEPGLFDASFFNMSPKEALTIDPQMRLALVTAYEALERAGYVGNRTASTRSERIGTFYGQTADDYREVNMGQEVDTYYTPGGCRAFGPGRINYFFKFAGPSYIIDTACSSGLAAIELACQGLWKGEVDTAVAGGVNVLTNCDGFTGLCKGHFLTKGHNACKTWDATADGYCRADGIGSLVIKRLEDAEADNDNILGVILGAGTNHSAQAISITHPHGGHQAYLARQVLRQAGVDPLDVSYVELHGTGTQAGDVEEMKGITEVYAPLTRRRGKDQPLHIGAVKSNIGHGESVAGTTALIKVLLMLQKNAIPPHVGIKTEINPKLNPKDLEKRNIRIPFQMTPWTGEPGKKRITAINNFGAAGGNTTLLLEEAPARGVTELDPRGSHVFALSAKTKASLKGNIERLLAYLDRDGNGDTNLADLSYTTTARRSHYNYRLAVAASNMAQLKKALSSRLEKIDSIKPASKSSDPPSIAFTFTGQGASYKSMSLELYRDVPEFRSHIQHLDSLARGQGFPSFIPAIDGSHGKDEAHSPVVTQLALVCTEMALAKYWSSSLGVKPDIVMGHSLGEYAAMHVAGVTTASDTIFMVGRRAQMMEARCQAGSHTMMAVRASLAQIAENCGGKEYTIACINGPSDTVLSGTKDQMDAVAVPLEAAGFRCIRLDVAYAFHSEQTDPILDDFEGLCKSAVLFQEPKLPVISPLLGKVIFDAKTLNANYVRRGTREAVDFLSALKNARTVSAIGEDTIWIEIGPHPVCTGFVKSTIPGAKLALPSMRRGEDNWKTIAEALAALHAANVEICWDELHRPFQKSLHLLDLPTYAFNEKNYWIQYQGDWTLSKGNTFYGTESRVDRAAIVKTSHGCETSTVQQIVEESLNGSAGTVVMQSDLMQPEFLAAAHGHKMNNCGVVTSSIHADIAFTLGGYLYRKLTSKALTYESMNMTDLHVSKGLVAQKDKNTPQLIRVTATTADIYSGTVDLTWQCVDNDGSIDEPFATAKILLRERASSEWLSSWSPMAHLVQGRIDDLQRLARQGTASRFSRNMAYTLFASNLVTYADKYRGMQSVVMHELEGFADVELTTHGSGSWTVAPFFIDSVAHLAGFIMNCSDALDTKGSYSVTPGWKSMRFARPLVPGAKYRSYVKMIPSVEDATVYFGDVYVLQDGVIVGMVGGIEFRRYPRILLDRFFSPPDKKAPATIESKREAAAATPPAPVKTPHAEEFGKAPVISAPKAAPVAPPPNPAPSTPEPNASAGTTASKALVLIAEEAGLELSDLQDDAGFANLGIDSLMSLVIAEKLKRELDVKVSGSLFLDYPTIGDLRKWLEEYYD